jgi:hypothetical protein
MTMRTFAAGLLIGVGLWMPVFVAASAEGDAHGWSTLVALGLFAFAALLGARFERRSARVTRASPADAIAAPAPERGAQPAPERRPQGSLEQSAPGSLNRDCPSCS